MHDITHARAKVRELAEKGLGIVNDTTMQSALQKHALDRVEAELKYWTDEVRQLEHVEQRRKTLFGGTDPGSVNGGPTAVVGKTGQFGAAPPLTPSEDQLRALHDAVLSHKSLKIEVGMKDGPSALLPDQLAPGIVALPHEPTRIMDLIPTSATSAPSYEYLRHVSTTGTAGTVAAGGLKPSVTLNLDKLEARARKIAVTTVVNDEDLADFGAFMSYVSAELQRLVIDEENAQLIAGDGTGENLEGFLSVVGILTRAKGAAPETGLDTLELAATDLRTGPAFTNVSVFAMHPTTWSGLRRTKDDYGRYILGDPASADAGKLWGSPIVQSTALPIGTAVGLAASEAGEVKVRQGLTVQTDYGQTGWEHNQTSFRAEERVALAVVKPAAVIEVTGL